MPEQAGTLHRLLGLMPESGRFRHTRHNPLHLDLLIIDEAQELAPPQAFQRNPRLVWEWYAWRRTLVAQVQPNPGHFALARSVDGRLVLSRDRLGVLPHTVLLDGQGRVIESRIGVFAEAALESRLEAITGK